MQRVELGALVILGAMLAGTSATAQQVTAINTIEGTAATAAAADRFMRVFGPAQPPHGFVRFCEAVPNECASDRGPENRFNASAARLRELAEVNRSINQAIAPATDLEIYGINEYWTLPRTKGDCEDYALLKRQTLIKKGWPVSSLLLTVVRDEKGEGHAVLTARTRQGDFILDNKLEDVTLWSQTPYRFVMRQSYLNPHVWVALNRSQGPLATSLSGGLEEEQQ